MTGFAASPPLSRFGRHRAVIAHEFSQEIAAALRGDDCVGGGLIVIRGLGDVAAVV
jgi:hypothetical protein